MHSSAVPYLGILPSCPAVLQSCLGILQFCLSILSSRPVSPQSSPRRSPVLALYFDQLRAPFTESTPPAATKSHAPFTGSAPLLPPKPQSPIVGLLRCCRRSLTYLLRDLPRRGGLLVAKTKIPPFLQLFCDCGLPSIPKKRNRTATQLDHLRFCVSIRNWKVLNNPQSQKSCTASRFFVFEPPGMASGRVWSILRRQRCGRSREAAARNIAKTKKRGHPTSDALALFSSDVAPTLALTPYSRTQVPSGDRIPRLYA